MKYDRPDETELSDLSGLLIEAKTRQAVDAAEFRAISKVYQKYLTRPVTSKSVSFTYEWLLETHKEMFGEIWSWAGEKRSTQKNVGVPPQQIGSEIHRLMSELHQWEKEKADTFEIGVRLHHRLVWIHPFENGNGRWARLVSDIYLRKNRLPVVKWPSDPVVVEQNFKPRYVAALKSADHGDWEPLLKLIRDYWH
jgi:Fic-DOC domain mobile mystery protein B